MTSDIFYSILSQTGHSIAPSIMSILLERHAKQFPWIQSSIIILLHIPSCVSAICMLMLMFPSLCVWWRLVKRDADGWFGPSALQPGRHQVEFAAEYSALEPGSPLEIYSPPCSRAPAWAFRQHWSRQEVWAFSKTHSLPHRFTTASPMHPYISGSHEEAGLVHHSLSPNSQNHCFWSPFLSKKSKKAASRYGVTWKS